MEWAARPQELQSSLRSVTLRCQDTSLSMLRPVLDLALPAGKWACEDAALVEDVEVWLRDPLRSQEPLTCSNTTHSGTVNSALRPPHCSRHSGAALEPLPLAHPACRSQPTWEKGQGGLAGPHGWGHRSTPAHVHAFCIPPTPQLNRPHLRACSRRSCSEGLNTCCS